MLAVHAAKTTAPNDVDGAIVRLGTIRPIGRVIQVDKVAKLVLSLCSDEARAITFEMRPLPSSINFTPMADVLDEDKRLLDAINNPPVADSM